LNGELPQSLFTFTAISEPWVNVKQTNR